MSTQIENANAVEQYEKTEKSEKKLMNKTKKELIDIIFRKDDVESKLRKELSDLNLDFTKAKKMITKKDDTIHCLEKDCEGDVKVIKDLKETINTVVEDNDTLETKYNKMKITTIIFGAITIISLILLFVF